MKPALLLLLAAASLAAAEITTGAILGRGFDQRAFYTRNGPRDSWEKTYSAPRYRPEARGKLMSLRRDAAVSPESLDFYKNHGILMVTVNAAFRSDGAPDPDWLARFDRLLAAAGQRGIAVNLVYFSPRQEPAFDSTKAIHAAARGLSDWLIARNARHLLVEVAAEFDAPASYWGFDGYIPQHIIPLIDEVRARFRAARILVPVSASGLVRTRYPESLAGLADVIPLIGAGRPFEQKTARLAELKAQARPVLMTADDPDPASCDLFFRQAAGWGSTGDPHSILDRIARLVLRSPPD